VWLGCKAVDDAVARPAALRRRNVVAGGGGGGGGGVNVFGAPCDVVPPFTRQELTANYLGCQSLPTAVWLMKLRSASSSLPASLSGAAASLSMSDGQRTSHVDDLYWNHD